MTAIFQATLLTLLWQDHIPGLLSNVVLITLNVFTYLNVRKLEVGGGQNKNIQMITSGIKKQTNVNFHNLTFFILLLCFRLNRPGIFLLSDECNAGKRFGCAKYPLCMPLVKIIIRTNNISEVNRDFLAYVVCHSVKWVPNLWELSQLGKNFLSWPPAVGKKHNRQNNDKTNSLWCCWTQEAKLLLSFGSQINRIMVRPPSPET